MGRPHLFLLLIHCVSRTVVAQPMWSGQPTTLFTHYTLSADPHLPQLIRAQPTCPRCAGHVANGPAVSIDLELLLRTLGNL